MTSQDAVRRLHLGLIRGASLLVPVRRRSDWWQEWRTELWYVLRECSPKTSRNPGSILEVTAFCLGAYQDAIWLWRRSWQESRLPARIRGSASVCLLLLIGMFFPAWGIAHFSSRVAAATSRIQVYPWRPSDHRAPCDCAFDLAADGPSLRTAQLFFDGFSHYAITHETVRAQAMPGTEWTVAHARSDFFAALHLPLRLRGPAARGSDKLPRLVLSDETWRRHFGGSADITGTKVRVGSVDVIVAGVAFGSSMGLPRKPNAWFLGSDREAGTDDDEFVVARLSPAGYFDDGRWTLSAGGILLAFLLMPFAIRTSTGEYSHRAPKPALRRRSEFWAFLIAKITVLVGFAYFVSVDFGCLFVKPSSPASAYIETASSFGFCLLGLSWAFSDQRRRCPVCLRRMAHPVAVGQPSRTFLAWNGTELVCESGHTLLHIPEISTSWFSGQRWVCLDVSWRFMFTPPEGTGPL